MRILYVDIFGEAINPTGSLTPLLVRTIASDTVFYGPGFSGPAELALGIDRFIDRRGPFDVVVFGPNVPLLTASEQVDELVEGTIPALQRYSALVPDRTALSAFLYDVIAAAGRLPIPIKVVSTMNFDYYACTPAQIDRVQALGLHILGPNRQFVGRLAELPDYARQERHYRRKEKRLSDAYAEFVSAYPERVLTAVHFVAETEFSFRHVEGRPYRMNVPGVEYVLRGRAIDALAGSGISIAPKRVFHAYRLLGRLRLPVFGWYLPLKLYHLAFHQGLIDSQLVFTARGGFGMPIRKFFEIPAAGALMLCVPPHGFADLGFQDGTHYIEAAPENLADIVGQLENAPEKVGGISQNGRDLVFARHSLAARAAQIRTCLEATIDGSYRGAEWADGEFSLLQQHGSMRRNSVSTVGSELVGTRA